MFTDLMKPFSCSLLLVDAEGFAEEFAHGAVFVLRDVFGLFRQIGRGADGVDL